MTLSAGLTAEAWAKICWTAGRDWTNWPLLEGPLVCRLMPRFINPPELSILAPIHPPQETSVRSDHQTMLVLQSHDIILLLSELINHVQVSVSLYQRNLQLSNRRFLMQVQENIFKSTVRTQYFEIRYTNKFK